MAAGDRGNLYQHYNTFSGTDMVASILLPDQKPIPLGQVSALRYTITREKMPIKTLGRINVRGFAKGPRTIQGVLSFTVFDEHVVNTLRSQLQVLYEAGRIVPDELPPFDLILTGANEFGASASMRIYGVTVVEDGLSLTVDDTFTANEWHFMARDIRLLERLAATDGQLPEAEGSHSSFRDGTDIKLGTFTLGELDAMKAAREYDAAIAGMIADRARERQAAEDRAAALQDAVAVGGFVGGTLPSGSASGQAGGDTLASLMNTPVSSDDHGHVVLKLYGKGTGSPDGSPNPESIPITRGVKSITLDNTGPDATHREGRQIPGTNMWVFTDMPIITRNWALLRVVNEPEFEITVDTAEPFISQFQVKSWTEKIVPDISAHTPGRVYVIPHTYERTLDDLDLYGWSTVTFTDDFRFVRGGPATTVPEGMPFPVSRIAFAAAKGRRFPEQFRVGWYYAVKKPGESEPGAYCYGGIAHLLTKALYTAQYAHMVRSGADGGLPAGSELYVNGLFFPPGADPSDPGQRLPERLDLQQESSWTIVYRVI